MGFHVQKRDYKMKLEGDKQGRKGHLSVATEVSCVLYSGYGNLVSVAMVDLK